MTRNPLFAPLLVATLSLLLAGAAALHQHRENQLRQQQEFDHLRGRIVAQLHARWQVYEMGLRGARGVVIGAGGESITRARFRAYMSSRSSEQEFPGARGYGFIRRVPAAQEGEFLRRTRTDGAPDFRIKQLTAHADERFVIEYIEPPEPNQAAIGLDVASEDLRRQAALDAMHSGQPRLTAPLTLVQAANRPHSGFLLLLPVYRQSDLPATRGEREASTIGWVYTPLVINEVLQGLDLDSHLLALRIADVTDPARAHPFYVSHAGQSTLAALEARVPLHVSGRQWQIELRALPAFVESLDLLTPWQAALLTGGSGALLSGLLLAWLYASRHTLSEANARDEQQRLRQILDAAPCGIVILDERLHIQEANAHVSQITGYWRDDLLGQPASLLTPDGQGHWLPDSGDDTPHVGQIRHQDGRLIDVDVGVNRLLYRQQTLTVATISDVSERQTQARSLQAYAGLQRAMLDSAGHAIIGIGTDGLITLFNPAAERMLGYSAEEMIGKAKPLLFHLTDELEGRAECVSEHLGRPVAPDMRLLFACAGRPELNHQEWTWQRRDGSRLTVQLALSDIRSDSGELLGYLSMASNISEHKQLEQSLRENERFLRELMDVVPGMLGYWTADLHCRFANIAYLEWFGRTPQEMIGISMPELLGEELFRKNEPYIRAALRGEVQRFERTLIKADGSTGYTWAHYIPIWTADGVDGFFVLVSDVTELKLTQLQLEQRNQLLHQRTAEAEAASQAKSSFLANMSHELRTPMNAILGLTELLQHTPLDARQADYTRRTAVAARTLLGVLDDILDFSKIEAGQLSLRDAPFDLDALLGDLAITLGSGLAAPQLDILLDIAPDVPRWLQGDRLRLQQVLINLLGNAIKFTPTGEVRLSISLLQRQADAVHVRLAVQDTGIGIAREQQAQIFEGFRQLSSSNNRTHGGTGLGLAISRRLVQLMGGDLLLHSELGHGSTFTFDLRLGLAPPQAEAQRPGLQALVVYAREAARNAVARQCQRLGWRVHGCAGLEEAAAWLQRGQTADVVLLDWPAGASPQLQQQLQTLPVLARQAVVALLHDPADEARAPAVHVLQPLAATNLLQAVDAAVHAGRLQPASLPRPLAGLRLLVVEDNDTNQLVTTELLQLDGAQVTQASSGQQALLALEPGAFDAVLLDIQMPGMDGYATARAIRQRPGLEQLPVIALTASAMAHDRAASLAAGMNEHLAKPVDMHVLRQRLLLLTGRDAPVALPAEGQAAAEPLTSIRQLLQRMPVPGPTMHRLLRAAAGDLQQLRGELLDAAGQAQHTLALRLLHTLKGSAGSVGARELTRRAAALEAEWRASASCSASEPGLLALMDVLDATRAELLQHLQALLAADGAPPRLLLAAVDPLIIQTLYPLLGSRVDVFIATSAAELERLQAQHQPQLVLLDTQLAGGDTLDICRQLRQQEAGRSLHLVLLQTGTDDLTPAQWQAAGVDACLDLPLQPGQVRDCLQTVSGGQFMSS